MMKKSCALILAISVILMGVGRSDVVATTPCTVTLNAGDDIQSAVDGASAGDVICLNAGVYSPSSKINIDKQVTLQGPQAGVDPRPSAGPTRTPGDNLTEAIIDGSAGSLSGIIVITADNVVLDGLEVRNGSGDLIDSEDGIPTTGTILRYNIIDNATGDEGIQLRNVNGSLIEFNHVVNVAQDGINVCCGSTNGVIRFNEVHNNGSENAAIYIYDSEQTTIECNLVYDVFENDGIKLGAKGGGDASRQGGSIRYNTVFATAQDGITVYTSDALVEGNEVYNSASENGAIYVAWAVANVTITKNDLHDNVLHAGKWGDPGAIMIGTAVDASTVHVNYNNIYGNTTNGVTNKAVALLDALNNWWGDATGPSGSGSGSGDRVSTNVDFEPWLSMPQTIPDPCAIDDEGPITSDVIATPNPAAVNADVSLTANVDDSATGGSNIASAEYSLDGVTWYPMSAVDPPFDAVSEDVIVSLTAPEMSGIYALCVRGTDAAGNTGAEECSMLVVYDPDGGFVTGGGWIDSPEGAFNFETTSFFNDFETDIDGWFNLARVESGTDDIISASGDYHAKTGPASGGAVFTQWGGYNSAFPPGGYSTSIDIYLDVDGDSENDARFDWTSAISSPDGNHRRDFIFNGGYYNDNTGPGAGFNRFVFSASNNAPGWPKNPDRDPIAITESGWYTLWHRFYDGGDGVLAVDLSILDGVGNLIHTWTLSDPTDIIGVTVGGNRYGWFATNDFPFFAIDNSLRTEIHSPTGKATFGFVSKYKKGANAPTGNTEFVFKAADLNFHSTSYDWLIVIGSDYARFKGSGTINGEGDYRFMLWAGDGDPDTFRIRIWWEEDDTEHVIYDNGMAQPIGGGNIVIHTNK